MRSQGAPFVEDNSTINALTTAERMLKDIDQALSEHPGKARDAEAAARKAAKRNAVSHFADDTVRAARDTAKQAKALKTNVDSRVVAWAKRLRWLPGAGALLPRILGVAGAEERARASLAIYNEAAARLLETPSARSMVDEAGARAAQESAAAANRLHLRRTTLLEAQPLLLQALSCGVAVPRSSVFVGFVPDNPRHVLALRAALAADADERAGGGIGPGVQPSALPEREIVPLGAASKRAAMPVSKSTAKLPCLPGATHPRTGLVRLIVGPEMAEQAVAAGGRRDPRLGVVAGLPREGWRADLEPFLPYFARRAVPPLEPDLIPGSSWGSSLANLLVKSSWDTIRLPVIQGRGNLCQICGEDPRRPLECHELWAYALPPRAEIFGVQRLMGLASVCHDCHRMFHLGLANIQGRFEEGAGRLCELNGWSPQDFDAYWTRMGEEYDKRCKVGWVLDLSLVATSAPLKVKGSWTLRDDGILERHDPKGWTSETVILGVAFEINKNPHPARPVSDALDGLLPEKGDYGIVKAMGDGIAGFGEAA